MPHEAACDTCCGHGNEDGFCYPVGSLASDAQPPDWLIEHAREWGLEDEAIRAFAKARTVGLDVMGAAYHACVEWDL